MSWADLVLGTARDGYTAGSCFASGSAGRYTSPATAGNLKEPDWSDTVAVQGYILGGFEFLAAAVVERSVAVAVAGPAVAVAVAAGPAAVAVVDIAAAASVVVEPAVAAAVAAAGPVVVSV